MGKTADGAIWLDKKFLSPYDYWQFWRNVDDRDVIKFLKFFTDLSIDEIENFKNENINQLKILLANETTKMLHGEKDAENSEKTAKATFSENSLDNNLPSIQLKKDLNIIDLIILSELETSKSEIRRLIKGNAIKINNKLINDDKFIINHRELNENFLKLSIGKKRHLKIEFN